MAIVRNNDAIRVITGLDIGNGYVKGTVENMTDGDMCYVDFPSGVAFQTSSLEIKTRESEADAVISDIMNEMEAHFDSPAVGDTTRRLFGSRGVNAGKSTEEFDVSSTISKAQQDLSGVLVLGALAGTALQEYWKKNHRLPDETLKVCARAALALPITEFKRYHKVYADRFTNGTHMVSIHNFEKPVRVEITVEDVQVLPEGASAQYAIVNKGEPLMEAMLADLRSHGFPLEGITAADVLAATNTVGIDIGEGTVNFPVFRNNRFNVDVSGSFAKGYGTVLEQARERLAADGMQFGSRKELSEFLNKVPTALQRPGWNKAKHVVDEEITGFVIEVTQEFRKVMSRVGSSVEVVYVYGGGSGPMKNELYESLLKAAKHLGGEDVAHPILYLDAAYSRLLNREGLHLVAKQLAQSAGKGRA